MSGTSTIVRGNALALGLSDASVDLVVTSPPYFGLRSYQDGGEHYAGQIGDEATPAEFVDAIVAATAEMMRVLKPSGSIWVNLGDKYASSSNGTIGHRAGSRVASSRASGGNATGIPTKSLMGIPWRYAIRCIDDLGLILRAEVIWSKPNGLPESVTDRVRRSHETWFHFVKEPRYFSAVDEIREAHETPGAIAYNLRNGGPTKGSKVNGDRGDKGASNLGGNPLGKLPGSVWTIPTQPLKVPESLGIDHFAAFPMEWPRRIIQGWSPSGVCVECGEGRRPVVDRDRVILNGNFGHDMAGHGQDGRNGQRAATSATVTGYACACADLSADLPFGINEPPTTPAVVLDPFGGTGTTALVAKALGRHGISNDMSADYCRLAEWRTNDPGELARALQVEKPVKQIDGQADLFDLMEGLGA